MRGVAVQEQQSGAPGFAPAQGLDRRPLDRDGAALRFVRDMRRSNHAGAGGTLPWNGASGASELFGAMVDRKPSSSRNLRGPTVSPGPPRCLRNPTEIFPMSAAADVIAAADVDTFRADVRSWLQDNCPRCEHRSRRRRHLLGRAQLHVQVRGPAAVDAADGRARLDGAGQAAAVWRRRADQEQANILRQEMRALGCRSPLDS
jgi:hypothetical protein